MSSIYTIQIESGDLKGLLISLDATSEITHKYSGKATTNPTANRQSVSDHFIVNNPSFMIKGVVSGVVNPRDPVKRDTNEIVDRYKSVIENAKLVTFFSGQNRKEKNCFVERLSLTKNKDTGKDGWSVAITLSKINVATGGKDSVINIIPDQSSDKTNISASSTKEGELISQLEGGGLGNPDSKFGQVFRKKNTGS